MNDLPMSIPPLVEAAMEGAQRSGFGLSCSVRTGALLRTLAASKPGGRFLEIGTGVGVGTAWLLSGMDPTARLTTVEVEGTYVAVARPIVGSDRRCTLVHADAGRWLALRPRPPWDLAFVDWRTGKFKQRQELIAQLAPGGLYVVDDLRPQDTWPEGHGGHVKEFLAEIVDEAQLVVTLMDWSSGLVVAARRTSET